MIINLLLNLKLVQTFQTTIWTKSERLYLSQEMSKKNWTFSKKKRKKTQNSERNFLRAWKIPDMKEVKNHKQIWSMKDKWTKSMNLFRAWSMSFQESKQTSTPWPPNYTQTWISEFEKKVLNEKQKSHICNWILKTW